MSKSFAVALDSWAKECEKRTEAVYRRSVELLAEEMTNTKPNGGRVPFLTGNLARSLLASTVEMPKTADKQFSGDNVGLITANLTLKQSVYLGYQAIYARRLNYGYVGADVLGRVYNQKGNYFVEGALQDWQKIVDQAVQEVKGGV